MKAIFPLLTALSIWVAYSCHPPEPFPDKPHIRFNDLQYKPDERNGFQDSLILFFDFEDGDGDLGLDPGHDQYPPFDDEYPFHDFDIIVDSVHTYFSDGQRYAHYRFVTFGDPNVYPPYFKYNPFSSFIDPDTFSTVDDRPAFSCDYYDTLRINSQKNIFILPGSIIDIEGFKTDTVYMIKNPFRNNMFVDFYIDIQGNGNFQYFDWKYATSQYGCGLDFNGRFPIWDEDNWKNETSLQGTIKYSMKSLGFENILRTREFKLHFYIIDRSLNHSDTVITSAYTLQGLLRDQTQE